MYRRLIFCKFCELDSLMGTLSRTLQDEHKKSLEMSIAILSTFYYLSNYEEFHDLLMNVREWRWVGFQKMNLDG